MTGRRGADLKKTCSDTTSRHKISRHTISSHKPPRGLAASATVTALLLLCSTASAAPFADVLRRARSAAQRDLKRLAHTQPLNVTWAPNHARPTAVSGLHEPTRGETPIARARHFLAQNRALVFGSGDTLGSARVLKSADRAVVRFAQTHRGLPVLDSMVAVQLDAQSQVRRVTSTTHVVNLPTVTPQVSTQTAAKAVWRQLRGNDMSTAERGLLDQSKAILAVQVTHEARLVYLVVLPTAVDPTLHMHVVDAQTSEYLGSRPGVHWESVAQVRTAASKLQRRTAVHK